MRKAAERAGVPHWHPNQLRHTFATEVRRTHGLEAAQAALGHSKADVTQVYAERDFDPRREGRGRNWVARILTIVDSSGMAARQTWIHRVHGSSLMRWISVGQVMISLVCLSTALYAEALNPLEKLTEGVGRPEEAPKAPVPTAPPPVAIRVDVDGIRLPPGAIARLGSTRFRHPLPVLHCTYSPDGKTLATAAGDGVYLWNADTGRLVRRFTRSGADFSRLAFTPDAKTLFALSDLKERGGELFALNPATGEDRRREKFPELFFDTAVFSPDASRLAATTTDIKALVLVHCWTGKEITRITRQSAPPSLSHHYGTKRCSRTTGRRWWWRP